MTTMYAAPEFARIRSAVLCTAFAESPYSIASRMVGMPATVQAIASARSRYWRSR